MKYLVGGPAKDMVGSGCNELNHQPQARTSACHRNRLYCIVYAHTDIVVVFFNALLALKNSNDSLKNSCEILKDSCGIFKITVTSYKIAVTSTKLVVTLYKIAVTS